MKLVIPPLDIDEQEGFEKDILNRKAYGEFLRNIVRDVEHELVISIDADWGEGKTTFVKMWQGMLTKNNISNIYIDAFSIDYADDAFIPIVSAINNYVSKNSNVNTDEFIKKATNVARTVMPVLTKMGIKAVTLNTFGDTESESFKNLWSNGAAELVDQYVKDRVKSHEEEVNFVQSFREDLSKLPSKLNENKDTPLVIIIDELDRCRPPFAVQVIEKIKHLFSVKNVVFVLVMNKKQLEVAVKKVYGQDIDAHTYLQKFITIESSLPQNKKESHVYDIKKYSQRLFELHGFTEPKQEHSVFYENIVILSKHYDLSLRQLEKVYTNIVIVGLGLSNKDYLTEIVVFLAMVKVCDPPLFNRLKHKDISFSELIEKLAIVNFDRHRLHALLKCILMSDNELSPIDDFISNALSLIRHYFRGNRDDVISEYAVLMSSFTTES